MLLGMIMTISNAGRVTILTATTAPTFTSSTHHLSMTKETTAASMNVP
jgi:hypothetical protein